MKINTTFQLMDEIAKVIVGPRPKVIANQTRASRDHLKNFFEMAPLKNNYKRIPEDPVNFIQIPIEGIPTYPIKALSILTGFEPNIENSFDNKVDQVSAILLHPYLTIDSKQAIILSNHFLRTSFELGGLMNINKDTLAADAYDEYASNMEKPDNLLLITSSSLENLYSYLFSQTKELGLFQDQYTFDQQVYFDSNIFDTHHTSSELMNEFILAAMANVTIRKIYDLIVTSTDKSIIADKTVAFDKLFNGIYAQNFIYLEEHIISRDYDRLYKQYDIIVHSLIDLFMDADPSNNIDMWLNMICMAYEEYENKK